MEQHSLRLGADPGFSLLAAYEVAGVELPELETAHDASELARVWRAFQLAGEPPAVDFSRFTVLSYSSAQGTSSASSGGPHCLLTGFELRSDRVLFPDCAPAGETSIGVPRAGPTFYVVHVLAVNREALPPGELALRTVRETSAGLRDKLTIFRIDSGQSDKAKKTQEPRGAIVTRKAPAAQREMALPHPLGLFNAPAPGDVCLAPLEGGARAWLVHHASGDLSVIAGDYALSPVHARTLWQTAEAGVRGRSRHEGAGIWGFRVPTRWDSKTRSFGGLFDEYGTAIVATLGPLDAHAFQRLGVADRVAVGPRVPGAQRSTLASVGYWPTQSAGGIAAYGPGPAKHESLPLLQGDLVAFPDASVHLCPPLEQESASPRFRARWPRPGCDGSSPLIRSVQLVGASRNPESVPSVAGPFRASLLGHQISSVVSVRGRSQTAASAEPEVVLCSSARETSDSK